MQEKEVRWEKREQRVDGARFKQIHSLPANYSKAGVIETYSMFTRATQVNEEIVNYLAHNHFPRLLISCFLQIIYKYTYKQVTL